MPPPLLLVLEECMKSKLGGVASIRVQLLLAGFSHVSVSSMESRQNLDIRSLIKNDLLERDLTFRRAILVVDMSVIAWVAGG